MKSKISVKKNPCPPGGGIVYHLITPNHSSDNRAQAEIWIRVSEHKDIGRAIELRLLFNSNDCAGGLICAFPLSHG